MINELTKHELGLLIETEYDEIAQQYLRYFNISSLSASYLFNGPPGIGKRYLAKLFAKLLVCESYQANCSCQSCLNINNGTHSDILHFDTDSNCDLNDANHRNHNSDGSRSIKICQIKRINRISMLSPTTAKYKIFIVSNINLMTPEAANALLKTLEDAPQSTIFLLIANDINNVLDTVKSRCHIIEIPPLNFQKIQKILSKKFQIDDHVASDFAILSRARIDSASQLANNQENVDSISKIFSELSQILNAKTIDRINFAENLNSIYRSDPALFHLILNCWEDWFRWHLYAMNNINIAPSFFNKNSSFSFNNIISNLKNIAYAKNQLAFNVNSLVSLQILLLRMQGSD
ncbi:MAG: ATP-binding protein [Dehalococcoidia bacterium]